MKRQSRYITPSIALAAFLALVLISACGPARPEEPQGGTVVEAGQPYDPIDQGRAHYMRYCASCHGPGGHGDGPVAEALKDTPTDITRLRSEEGVFDIDSLIVVIQGLKDVRAHGTREMPVWGNIWGEANLRETNPRELETRINELVEYIRTIQG